MQELNLNIYTVQEVLDKKTNVEDILGNIGLIKMKQQEMAETVAKAVLAPLVCKYEIDCVDLVVDYEMDDCTFRGNIMNYINKIDGFESQEELTSIDGTETISYAQLQEEISDALEDVYFLLNEDVFIDVKTLRQEYLHANLSNELEGKSSIKAKKI